MPRKDGRGLNGVFDLPGIGARAIELFDPKLGLGYEDIAVKLRHEFRALLKRECKTISHSAIAGFFWRKGMMRQKTKVARTMGAELKAQARPTRTKQQDMVRLANLARLKAYAKVKEENEKFAALVEDAKRDVVAEVEPMPRKEEDDVDTSFEKYTAPAGTDGSFWAPAVNPYKRPKPGLASRVSILPFGIVRRYEGETVQEYRERVLPFMEETANAA